MSWRCGRCDIDLIGSLDDHETCWYCVGALCVRCWDELGHCGHAAAIAINEYGSMARDGKVPIRSIDELIAEYEAVEPVAETPLERDIRAWSRRALGLDPLPITPLPPRPPIDPQIWESKVSTEPMKVDIEEIRRMLLEPLREPQRPDYRLVRAQVEAARPFSLTVDDDDVPPVA